MDDVIKKRYKMAANYVLFIGIANLTAFIIFLFVKNSLLNLLICLFIGIAFSALYYFIRQQNKESLRLAVIIWCLMILSDIFNLILFYHWGLIVLLFIKFSILLYLIAPLKKDQKEHLWERGISKIPYVLPILILVPWFCVFYITFLVTENIFYSFLTYLPPIIFLLGWLYFNNRKTL